MNIMTLHVNIMIFMLAEKARLYKAKLEDTTKVGHCVSVEF